MTTDADVTACLAIHSTTSAPRCADCRVCADCDVNVDADEYGDVRCESCLNAHEQERRDRVLAWSYGHTLRFSG